MKKFFTNPLVWSAFGLLCLSLLIWFLFPLISIGDDHPFDGVIARLASIAVLLLLFGLVQLLRVWRRKRKNAALMAGMSGDSMKP